MRKPLRNRDKDPEDLIQNARQAADRRRGRPVDASWDRDVLMHVRRLRDVGDWQAPDCHRLNWRVAAEWEVPVILEARLLERAVAQEITRGLV
jgi:hypothetical protein